MIVFIIYPSNSSPLSDSKRQVLILSMATTVDTANRGFCLSMVSMVRWLVSSLIDDDINLIFVKSSKRGVEGIKAD